MNGYYKCSTNKYTVEFHSGTKRCENMKTSGKWLEIWKYYLEWGILDSKRQRPHILICMFILASNFYVWVLIWKWVCAEAKKWVKVSFGKKFLKRLLERYRKCNGEHMIWKWRGTLGTVVLDWRGQQTLKMHENAIKSPATFPEQINKQTSKHSLGSSLLLKAMTFPNTYFYLILVVFGCR